MVSEVLDRIAYAFANLQDSELKKLLEQALNNIIPASEILEKALRRGLSEVGDRYEAEEFFLSELLFAASLMNDAMTILGPRLTDQRMERKGSIVLGTVKGDMHDIGKNIFKMIAKGAGFEVLDLGVDAEPESFAQAIKQEQRHILALSALLTTTIPEMKTVVEQLDRAHLRDHVHVLIGGNAVTDEFGEQDRR